MAKYSKVAMELDVVDQVPTVTFGAVALDNPQLSGSGNTTFASATQKWDLPDQDGHKLVARLLVYVETPKVSKPGAAPKCLRGLPVAGSVAAAA